MTVRSMFKLSQDCLTLWTIENIDVSSANSFVEEIKLLGKSLI